ncbi:putative modifying wall lignin-1/2 [Helianthus annuus]|nr:putative modifying wall lignin-1/2 [Helianthus annuus]
MFFTFICHTLIQQLCYVSFSRLVSFLGAEACLLAGSAKNAYHTKYRVIYGVGDLSCETLRKGVFAGGAALTCISMVASVVYYLIHLKADTGGWQKHQNEGLGMASLENPDRGSVGQFEKL